MCSSSTDPTQDRLTYRINHLQIDNLQIDHLVPQLALSKAVQDISICVVTDPTKKTRATVDGSCIIYVCHPTTRARSYR